MRLELKSTALSSRLAQRIFLTFIACAMIPVIFLACFALFQVSSQLEQQAYHRLRRAAKSHALSIFEHLMFCEDELKLVGLLNGEGVVRQQEKFTAIGRRFPDGRYVSIFGDPIAEITLTSPQRVHLARGASLLAVTGNRPADLTLMRYFDAGAPAPGLLMATVRGDYLWGLAAGTSLPPLTEFAVLTQTMLPLYQSENGPLPSASQIHDANESPGRVELADTKWVLASWPLFLQAEFGAADWSLVVLESEANVLAPIDRFKIIFILVAVLALLLVVALSLFNLRRSLEPIHALKTGALHVAQNDFAHRVRVTSRDEFQDLAQSFNDMSSQLGRQFQLLSTRAKIDQATLMDRDFSHIAGLSITRVLKDFALRIVAISRVNTNDPDAALIYMGHQAAPDVVSSQPFSIAEAAIRRFHGNLPWLTIDDPTELSRYLLPESLQDVGPVTFFPVFVKERLFALLAVAGQPEKPPLDDHLSQMRQIADHLGVAWSNVKLIRDLRRLTIGSMQALARAVDAKSPWTAGHSARVMRIALGIGRHLGLSPDNIEQLQQAALLHDIGKIGISSAILDKPGKLTDDEFAAIRQHPVIGDTILAPIPAFKAIIPMVRQHHECWDGTGYPDGLSGEAITLEGRILAVADVYDAMATDRPYRKGMEMSRVIAIIRSQAGRQFDPRVVAAFLEMTEKKSALAA